ncbi:hypothetical protein GVN20_07865 [Runella sp. CRIBMP]|jgi:hypothetical protein|uniref:Outer membrane protein beta-barrel domain-containing protein n=1 Tax=Runella salmonicolor TaxID=2950278 RepID=A0ABT1FLB6_9BACT|nr:MULTISPECIES: hypothetical protein [Runella]MCP1382555.1 hypothetical protein [Runella salmonicolor]NBB19267.1 hypothetical protein [Runella sp. CRIBMP]
MKSISTVILAFLLLSEVAWGQQRRAKTNLEDEEEEYSTITTYGVTTNTNSGLLGGLVVRHSTRMDKDLFGRAQYRYLALELVNVRHPKELAQSSNTGARFTPGKQNYLFALRPQYGREIILSNRNNEEGISINGILAVGASLGILKPYFIQYQVRPGVVRTEAYDPVKHTDLGNILGAGNIMQGIGQSKIVPGVNAKIAFSFELSAFRSNLTGLEIGFLTELFSKAPVIIPFAENRSLFTSGYVTLFFGNKK